MLKSSSNSLVRQGFLSSEDVWQGRKRTVRALVEILRAKWLIAFVPIAKWRADMGLPNSTGIVEAAQIEEAKRWAAHVDRAALRLPVSAKCLPQAIALSRILKAEATPHRVTIAHQADADPDLDNPHMLHAWLEVQGRVILGELPGDWNEILRMPD